MTDCIPARNCRTGEILAGSSAVSKARWFLEQREGPPPFEKALCRHLCKNDSQAHKRENGFVCVLHTTWGTYSENETDKPSKTRTTKLHAICPHCGKTGQHMSMMRWHFHNCKFRPEV